MILHIGAGIEVPSSRAILTWSGALIGVGSSVAIVSADGLALCFLLKSFPKTGTGTLIVQ